MSYRAMSGIYIAFSYFLVEFFLIPHMGLSRDEFWFGHHIYQYISQVPYRDFLPYKPVLGYDLLRIPFYFSHAVIGPLYYIKQEIAFLNMLFLTWAVFYSQRFFNAKAICLTCLLILSSQLFLIISVDLRVDMLASWLGLASALLILSYRFRLAGIASASAFLISQKALWCIAATNLALFACVCFMDRKLVWGMIQYNVIIMIGVLSYVLYWSYYSSLSTVLNSVFYEAYSLSKITWYHDVYYSCWQTILSSGPLLFLLWPLTWLGLWMGNKSFQKIFVYLYASVFMLFIFQYKQPFLYNMVFCVPAFFLLYSEFFTWLFKLLHQNDNEKYRAASWLLSLSVILVSVVIMSVILFFDLKFAYFLILFIPVSIYFLIQHHHRSTISLLIILSIIFTGIIYPFVSSASHILFYISSGRYQQSMILLADDLLKNGGEYIAGTPLLYQKNQPIPGLRNLVGPQLEYLQTPSDKLLPLLVSSLYLTPRSAGQVLEDLKSRPIMFYVNNNRIAMLPQSIRKYLSTHYQHFWGSIYLYAPEVLSIQRVFPIKFSGEYLIQSDKADELYIDNVLVHTGQRIKLTMGNHRSNSNMKYRITLVPMLPAHDMNTLYRQDHWEMLGSV